MTSTTVPTFWARIFVGLREGYEGRTHSLEDVAKVCQEYCDKVGLCVTLERCGFVYKGGREEGMIVGLINYPRFPSTPQRIKEHALTLAGVLRDSLGQLRVSVLFPDETVMIGDVT